MIRKERKEMKKVFGLHGKRKKKYRNSEQRYREYKMSQELYRLKYGWLEDLNEGK